ncbi:MAG: DUF1751 domain-containing protein [Leptonema sp. (in: bacteria)]
MNSYYGYSYPLMTVGVFRIVLLLSISYLIQLIASFFPNYSLESFLLSSSNFSFISFLTHFFVVPIQLGSFLGFLFDILILWGFGSELERVWGTKNFYQFFFVGIFGGALFLLLVSSFLLQGLYAFSVQAGIAGVLLAYGILWPNREVLFFMVLPIKMKWVILLMFLFMILSSLNYFVISLGGVLSSGLYFFLKKLKQSQSYTYSNVNLNLKNDSAQNLEKKNFFTKIKDKISQFQKKKRIERKRQEILKRIEMKEELDRILEKISRQGIESLTRAEKKFLDKASKEL